MIDDRIEEGLSEEAAVAAVGSAESIKAQLLESNAKADEEMSKKIKLTSGEITLLILGSPIWVSLIVVAAAVAITLYAVLWTLTAVAWAVEIPFYIFSFISKYFLIGCKWITNGALRLSSQGLKLVGKIFKREDNVLL